MANTPKPKGQEKVSWEGCVCIYCGDDVNAPTCPRCKKPTEINPGTYGQQTETEL